VSFEVIPAIDVSGGRLALFTPEGPRPTEAFGGDPLAAARTYRDTGARWIHVVDLDLAFGTGFGNLGIVSAVAELGVSVQASGGIATGAEAAAALAAGASRVVLGSGALFDEMEAERAIASLGERAIVGIEVDEGRIRPRGREGGDLPLVETLGWISALGAVRFLVTAVARVGGTDGPDLKVLRRVGRSGRPVYAAGGIATLGHLREVRGAGVAGAVVGRAALEGELDLVRALAL
jgi:phosphoribosylformimino-5-aminoimidazole carboxamide ribonucleotide (ProFAR) isomerase